jgi:hypothetical protein
MPHDMVPHWRPERLCRRLHDDHGRRHDNHRRWGDWDGHGRHLRGRRWDAARQRDDPEYEADAGEKFAFHKWLRCVLSTAGYSISG